MKWKLFFLFNYEGFISTYHYFSQCYCFNFCFIPLSFFLFLLVIFYTGFVTSNVACKKYIFFMRSPIEFEIYILLNILLFLLQIILCQIFFYCNVTQNQQYMQHSCSIVQKNSNKTFLSLLLKNILLCEFSLKDHYKLLMLVHDQLTDK